MLVRDWAHFTDLLSPLPAAGLRVLELRSDRKRDAALRRELFAAGAQARKDHVLTLDNDGGGSGRPVKG